MVFHIFGKTFSDMDVGQKNDMMVAWRNSQATGRTAQVPFGSNQPSVVL
jgi:hypothetical protein